MKNKYKYGKVDFKEYFKKKSKDININLEDIKNNTILSIFNDKETLLKFLINLDTNLKEYHKFVETEFIKINSDINSINDNVSQLDLNVETLNDNVASINDNIETLNENVETLETNADNLIPMQLWSNDANFNPNNLAPYNKYEWTKLESGRYIRATKDDKLIGTLKEETLPNLKWSAEEIGVNYNQVIVSGITKSKGGNYGNTNSGNNKTSLSFDASKINSVYKDNAKVQPNSINLVCWLRGNLRG